MLRQATTIAMAFISLVLASCEQSYHGPTAAISASKSLLIQDVTIIDVHKGILLEGMSILIAEGKIHKIAPRANITPNPETLTIDASGKYIIPGFNDMHAHPIGHGNPKPALALMLANGITGLRQMAGSQAMREARQAHTLPFTIDAPALLSMPAQPLTPFSASDEKDTAATIARQKNWGADFIKIGLVNPIALFAVLAEAKKQGLPTAGHVPTGVDILEAARAGMNSIEHLGPQNGALVACSKNQTALLASAKKMPPLMMNPPKIPFGESLIMLALTKTLVNPATMADQAEHEWLQKVVNSYDDAICRHAAAVYVANNTWQVPTLIRIKSSALAFLPEFGGDPQMQRYTPTEELETWRNVTQAYSAKLTAANQETLIAAYQKSLQLVKLMDDEGVHLLTGSDSSGAGWMVPGFAVHKEFDELEKAGLSPLRVLQMSTLNAAEFLNRSATMGSVALGKNADLVLLNANPLDSIQNLHNIHAVIRAGHYRSRPALDALMLNAQPAASH